MGTDITAESLDTPISVQSIVKSAKSNLRVPEGIASEHILISGDGTDSTDEPTVVGKQFRLSNRARGIRTEFTFFNEGFLKVREYKKRKLIKDYMLELRFLKANPTSVARFVAESFWAAVGLAGAAQKDSETSADTFDTEFASHRRADAFVLNVGVRLNERQCRIEIGTHLMVQIEFRTEIAKDDYQNYCDHEVFHADSCELAKFNDLRLR